MALIPDLPATTTLASSDLLLMDTGSVTQKITAQNAATALYELAKEISIVSTNLSANGSKTFTIGASTVALLMVDGSAEALKGLYIINSTSSGSVSTAAALSGSGISMTTGSGSLTVANSTGNQGFIRFIVFNGSVA